MGSKLWRVLVFMARPVSNCRLLVRIAGHFPHFRTVKVCPIPSGPETILRPEYLVDITDAWDRLASISPAGPEIKRIASFRDRFKRDCARRLRSHAEVQLLLHYEDTGCRGPSIDYFGCSKKTCFLCEGFLQALSHPISTRGRHGICYPAWGVPFSRSDEVGLALEKLGKRLISRIEMHLKGQPTDTFLNQVPQSTVVSDMSSLPVKSMLWKNRMVKSVEAHRQSLQRERRIV